MKRLKYLTLCMVLLLGLVGLASAQSSQTTTIDIDHKLLIAQRAMLAVKYPDHNSTTVDMVGTKLAPAVRGEARVKRKDGRTRVKVEMQNLKHPQSLGAYYTTYILWAIAPEGQAERVAELPGGTNKELEATTTYQTFGLLLTAEPHSAVTLPSPIIVAENAVRKTTDGSVEASEIEYQGDAGTLYLVNTGSAAPVDADYNTPLLVLGARRAVEIAHRAGARHYAEAELRQAEIKLAALEQTWPRYRRDRDKFDEKFGAEARDVMRLAEHARKATVDRAIQARLEEERRLAINTIVQSQSEADRARADAEAARTEAAAAKDEAAAYRDAMSRAEKETELAKQQLAQAQTEAERAKANEELARLDAERARLQSEQAQRERDALQDRLYQSLSAILETRREARGLIVNLSDVLFDFDKATLKPGAREKLSKLAGILLAYPGPYRIEIEGHTDSVGTDEYNLKLSQARAESVRDYLFQGGITADRVIGTRGFGELKPVATNDSDAGRQMNRRVEIIISDTDPRPVVNNPNQ